MPRPYYGGYRGNDNRRYKKVYDNRRRKYIIINNYNEYVCDADDEGFMITHF